MSAFYNSFDDEPDESKLPIGWVCLPLAVFVALIACQFCACAHLPNAHPNIAVVHALPIQKGDDGLYYDDANKDELVYEGIPDSFFVSTPRGWYLSHLMLNRAADIRDAKRNP